MMDHVSNEQFSEPRHDNLASAVGRIAAFLANRADAGAVAELRRLDVDVPVKPDFWWVYFRLIHPEETLDAWPRDEQRWARLVHLMAWLAGLHNPGIPLGKALALVGLSQLRFERLLRSDPEVHYDLVRRIALYLRSNQQACNQTDWALFLFYGPGRKRESFLRRLARDYYKNVYHEGQSA